MPELIQLTDPVIVQPEVRVTGYALGALFFQLLPSPLLVVHLIGASGSRLEVRYEGTPAEQILTGLNTANLTEKSMTRRLLEVIVADGRVAGDVVDIE